MGPLTTPKKGVEGHCVDPWTPTSNLKILISAASPEIRNREKERTLEEAEGSCRQDAEEVEEGERMTSRKDKSLGLLCQKFLERFPDYPDPEKDHDISLDDVASELNVERRRIYDIMNVLESLHMVSRSAKNRYSWHGRSKLAQTLFVLRRAGEEQGYRLQMQQIRQKSHEDDEGGAEDKENRENRENQEKRGQQRGDSAQDGGTKGGQQQQSKELCFVELPGVEFKAASVNSRKDKSLRVMSQKFVMLFLVARPRVVSLDVAAQILIGEDHGEAQDKNKFKTKVRRLYDIANVLRSLNLIEKVHVTEERGRKPAFEWVGPEEFQQVKDVEVKPEKSKVLSSQSSKENCSKNLFSNKRSFTRHQSLMKLAQSIQEDRRRVNSAPSSPAKDTAGDSRVDFPNKMAQLAAICKLQLDHESSGSKASEPAQASFPLTPVTPATPLTPLIPVLLQRQEAARGGAYAVYVPPPSLRAVTRPQPTSLAVRSMTFDSPTAVKRHGGEQPDASPSKTKRTDHGFKDASPKLGEILQARLKSRSLHLTNRASPRALHLDPEFLTPPNQMPELSPAAAAAAAANQASEQSAVDLFLEREERSAERERLTPIRAVPLTPGTIHTETLVPAGYLIPLPQSVLGFKDLQSNKETPATPTYLYQTPTTGSRPVLCQEMTPTSVHVTPTSVHVTPTSVHVSRASPLCPGRGTQSPSPAILNFTLQNLGLISGHNQVQAPVQTPTRSQVGCSPPCGPLSLSVPHRGGGGMVFIKPVSPLHVQGAGGGQQVALISLQQPGPVTSSSSSPGFFHTPVSVAPLSSVARATSGAGVPHGNRAVFVAQRKLDVGAEDL
ncbi:hypothetical protein NL108_017806 [Boleophthalmus pectinirostris]|uniref:transcription factor E2F8 n=1 Tax=Boleophthalmus pectinirostris TaxID=150288 RepID=UPI00242FE2D3|nr:transcription factor E2F8 [Boleophthalmus pectinirostris]KAJ0056803.1 hypothetical protein NL108_017806 [Boleophthalmus pectinirostris]